MNILVWSLRQRRARLLNAAVARRNGVESDEGTQSTWTTAPALVPFHRMERGATV